MTVPTTYHVMMDLAIQLNSMRMSKKKKAILDMLDNLQDSENLYVVGQYITIEGKVFYYNWQKLVRQYELDMAKKG